MGTRVNVLHVDSDSPTTDLTAESLERGDDQFTVRRVTSAHEASSVIAGDLPDCIISDYELPGTDGLELLRAIREEYPELPFILCTGEGSETIAAEAISAGVTDYFRRRPGSDGCGHLVTRIRGAVESRREKQQAARQEELMRLTEFAGDAGGFEIDLDADSVTTTDGADRLLDLPADEELTLENAVELYHPEDRPAIRRAMSRAVETGERTKGAWRYYTDRQNC